MEEMKNNGATTLPQPKMVATQTIFKCKNYDPVSEMIWTEYTPPHGRPRTNLFLPINARIRWFNNWCAENGLHGVIDESDVSLIAGSTMVQAICRVSINGELIATGISAELWDPTDQTKIPLCATHAKGRALANAGFSIATSLDDDFKMEMQDGRMQQIDDVDELNDEASLKVLETLQNADNPLNPKANSSEVLQADEQQKSKKRKPTPEEARSFKWPINNKYRGKTLGQVIEENGMQVLAWYVTDNGKGNIDRYRKEYPGFIESIQVLCGN